MSTPYLHHPALKAFFSTSHWPPWDPRKTVVAGGKRMWFKKQEKKNLKTISSHVKERKFLTRRVI